MSARNRPLVITTDRLLLDELQRLCDSAQTEPLVAPTFEEARRHWSRAPCVVLGHDAAPACADAEPPPHDRVAVLLPPSPSDQRPPWTAAMRLGASCVAPVTAARVLLARWFAPAPPPVPVIGVVGGGGGAGSSVLAAALALAAARAGRQTLLLDLDPLGGGLDLLIGWEARPGRRWPDLAGLERPSLEPSQLVNDGRLAVLATRPAAPASVPAKLLDKTLDAARDIYDVVVADLPRHPDAAATRTAERCTTAYLVARGTVQGSGAARAVLAAYGPHWDAPELIVRDADRVPVTEVADTLGLPLRETYESESELDDRVRRGTLDGLRPKGALLSMCTRLLAEGGVLT
ncbi:hypothetical protein Afil01_52610 [Actinorhabdospora filicis]|uniref:Rv3660c-like CheY-like N-terminal domain-containing protein n=1 Tax=Actinorhabdospora filicis TaxID=1785913 RepID=A0A9W6SR40_9ACTN|nr:septum site-determining protein Ssd [Actinorhabdospora filicis]GLZ80454.1 hypothetical protein Afil01_52610 [Actinorhabdospora filicis]